MFRRVNKVDTLDVGSGNNRFKNLIKRAFCMGIEMIRNAGRSPKHMSEEE